MLVTIYGARHQFIDESEPLRPCLKERHERVTTRPPPPTRGAGHVGTGGHRGGRCCQARRGERRAARRAEGRVPRRPARGVLMATIPWLVDVLRGAGVQVVTHGDWVNRMRPGDFSPIGVLWHHTA